MKKLFLALMAAVFLFGGTMTAQAYSEDVNGVRCDCSITNRRTVTASTTCSGVGVAVRSTAYNSAGNSIKSEEKEGTGYATVGYTTSQNIEYAVQVHTVPSKGISITRTYYI